MRFAALLLIPMTLAAQTPLEFGIVDDLIRGEPYISPLSIKIVQGQPAPGNATLRMAVRAGVVFSDEGSFLFVDSLAGEVNLLGRADYRGMISDEPVRRLFNVARSNMRTHGSSGITHFEIDFVTPDDMGWLSVRVPLTAVDSLLAGTMPSFQFWNGVSIIQVQVGMAEFPLRMGCFDPTQVPEARLLEVTQLAEPAGSHAWKSLLLPGWGQYSAGRGLPLVNLLAEAGGIALLVLSDDYSEVGIGVLVLNHLISFTDLL